MSRYTGPRLRKMRALGVDLPGLSQKSMWDRGRTYPPGQHGPNQVRRRKMSDYKVQLVEKQKLRFNYGLSEKALKRLFDEAQHSKEETGAKVMELLERRLDNVVWRASFARAIPAARQLVNHRHILVNGRRVNIPSYRIKVGDVISFRERSQNLGIVGESIENPGRFALPKWMEVDKEARKIKIIELPTQESVPLEVDLRKVIEFYS